VIKLAVFALLVSLAVGAGTGQARPGASSPTASKVITPCIATGASWRRGTRRGNKYVITRRNVTCAFAKTWVTRLSGRRATRPAQSIPGPRGWICIVTAPYAGRAAIGACGRGSGTGFAWGPKFS
jgi:hypothetical protein